MFKHFLPIVFAAILPTTACAQVDKQVPEPTAYEAILALDAQIFEAAFLTCDSDTLRKIMAPDLEFYHDIYGNIAGNVDEFLSGTIPDCEARQRGENPYVERKLITETMQVRPIGDWGAMQTGTHHFVGKDEAGAEILLETGAFTHIWQKVDGGWKIKRVISYDHK